MPNDERLIDLHCDWLLQYAGESATLRAEFYPEIAAARKSESTYFRQAAGYLTDVSAAVFACFRSSADWAGQADPWSALGDLIARVEAEFPGRVLIGPAEHARWKEDRDGLCWAVIGVEGFDALIRTAEDLARLPGLFERGVRWFQPSYGVESTLAGSSAEGDDRGLLPLGERFLAALLDLAPAGEGPRPVLDLAHLSPRSMGEVLAWFEADSSRTARVIPVYSHGAPVHPGFSSPRAITAENLTRLRALGGTVGFSPASGFFQTAEQFRAALESTAAIPFQGRPGYEGIAVGSDFLGVESTLPELSHAEAVLEWMKTHLDPQAARAVASGNAERLLARVLGVGGPPA